MNSHIVYVGYGMVNLIFFERSGNLELVHWERTNQRAINWIEKKFLDFQNNVPWEEWPHKIIAVFLVFKDEVNIEIVTIGQLVRTTEFKKYFKIELEPFRITPKTTDLDKIIAPEVKRDEIQLYKKMELPREEGDEIERHVIRNWPVYKELKGIM